MADKFDWPWHYKFPPFFTIQTNSDTRSRQLELWCNLVLAYHKHNKKYIFDVNEAQTSALFCNKDINNTNSESGRVFYNLATKTYPIGLLFTGKLTLEGINLVLETLQKKGNLEWEDKKYQRCFIMWKTPEEWGSTIYQWVKDNVMTGTVCTLFELQNGDDTKSQEFHGIDIWMLKRALQTLETKGKAQMFEGPTPGDDNGLGVKFFS